MRRLWSDLGPIKKCNFTKMPKQFKCWKAGDLIASSSSVVFPVSWDRLDNSKNKPPPFFSRVHIFVSFFRVSATTTTITINIIIIIIAIIAIIVIIIIISPQGQASDTWGWKNPRPAVLLQPTRCSPSRIEIWSLPSFKEEPFTSFLLYLPLVLPFLFDRSHLSKRSLSLLVLFVSYVFFYLIASISQRGPFHFFSKQLSSFLFFPAIAHWPR